MSLPEVTSREEWLDARRELLAKEKAATRARDALNTERRNLPMVRIDKEYVFDGPDGRATLLDLFGEYRQLIVRHFMFDPSWDAGCPSCTAAADEICDGLLRHLRARDTTLVVVSRAPLEKIERYKASRGWTFPWYSSFGGDFNRDFQVTLDGSTQKVMHNFREEAAPPAGESIETPGQSCFLRDGDQVFHTYSNYARGAEMVGGAYYYLDLTALGRQEEWEEPTGRADQARESLPKFE